MAELYQLYTKVSTLLEILDYARRSGWDISNCKPVSTLLEILDEAGAHRGGAGGDGVSTLLEILGLVYQVLVGF